MITKGETVYKLPFFTEQDPDAVMAFMKSHEFVTLIGYDGQQSVATQIPVLLLEREGQLYLRGHVMRQTDHHKAIVHDPEVLVLFQGAHCYVSSSWHTEKQGATWNYQTVHVRGTCNLLSEEETMCILTELTKKYETEQERPLYTDQLPENYMTTHVKAIAGIELLVKDVYPIFKLSQNRDDESYQNIVKHLLASVDPDAHKVAREM
ncbi:MAG: FMN-binding negative transcriptional regulator [Bacteroidota bacterium]